MTLTIRPTLERTAASLLLLSALPAVSADCFIDNRGREVCEGLSVGARVGIAFGVFFLIMLFFVVLGASRRRNAHRANQAYINNANATQAYPAPGYNYNQNNNPSTYNPTNVVGHGPQYPPPAHAPYEQYNGAPAYQAEPYSQPGIPPQYPSYAPPPGPPVAHKE